MPIKTLDQIAIGYGTDKATVHPTGPHAYTPHYERLFSPFRESRIKLLEIGVGGGESVRTWLDYFPNGNIYGVDISKPTNPWNTPKVPRDTEGRYTFVNGDQSCPTFWACFLADQGKDWNVIIDDGSHLGDHIATTFKSLWPSLLGGGLYCIEDLAVCYPAGVGENTMNWLRGMLDKMHVASGEIHSITFSRELAIIRKA